MPLFDDLTERLQRTLPHGRLRFFPLPLTPTIRLALFDPAVLQGPLSHEQAQAVVAQPAYWSFCWASGQVLAQQLLLNPSWVAGRRVVDIGSGSGVVAIAAAMAGAREVYAVDSDPDARLACQVNATHNGVELACVSDWQAVADVDLILAADILYDTDNHPMMSALAASNTAVLVADSRLKDWPFAAFQQIAQGDACTFPDLGEMDWYNEVSVYRYPRV